jgi:hypothetical protein
MTRFLRENSLSLAFVGLFLATLLGQSLVGVDVYNQNAAEHGERTIGWLRYLYSSEFGSAIFENWQSEFLQFSLFIAATIWLLQKGSNESKELDRAGLETDEQQRVGAHAERRSPAWAKAKDLRFHLYANSLLLVMTGIFFLTWATQSVTSWNEYNHDQQAHDEAPVHWIGYVRTSDFWEKSFQNWQSEFLAVGTLAVFTIYLRQRGSPESKPVGAPHHETGSSG